METWQCEREMAADETWRRSTIDANVCFNAGANEFRPAMSTQHFDPNQYLQVGHNGLEPAEGRWGPRAIPHFLCATHLHSVTPLPVRPLSQSPVTVLIVDKCTGVFALVGLFLLSLAGLRAPA